MLPDSSVRLNKYISESGICSRREADRYIEQGNVFLNGKRATIGDQVKPGDVVKVNGQLIEPRESEDLVLIALNKPVGIVSTTEDGERDNIVDFVNHSKRVFPISTWIKIPGLIFLTNHGDLVNKILRAGNDHEKEYLVTVDKPITDEFIRGMGAGVPILGTVTKSAKSKRSTVCLPHYPGAGAEPSDSSHVRALWLRSEKAGTYAHYERQLKRHSAG